MSEKPETCLQLNFQYEMHDVSAMSAQQPVNSPIANVTFFQCNVRTADIKFISRRSVDFSVVDDVSFLIKFLEPAPVEPPGAARAPKLDIISFLASQLS